MPQHLIIGGGPAAINAIETIRQFDATGGITLVSDEPAYARMVLPYYLAAKIPEGHVYTADDGYLDGLEVDRRIGRRVTKLDPKGKLATLDDGSTLKFDDCLIATGASPAIPPIPGADLPGVHPLWTLAHTEAILQAAQGKERPEVVFVGAGFIGFIVLNAMFKRGWKLHVVEIAPHVLPRMLNGESAVIVEKWLQDKGIALHLGATVQAIADANGRKRVTLSSGKHIDADIVVLATGIKPNLDWLKGSGIKIDQAVIVNDRMQTNFPHIYAAGDVAQGPDLMGDSGATGWHAIQPTAVDHGRIAGANMAGQDIGYPGSLLMNILDCCGLQCVSYGRWAEDSAEAMTINNPDRPVYRKLLWTGDEITGAVFVAQASDLGMLNDVGMVKGIMQTRTHFGEWKEYLKRHPFDIRRPFIALRVPDKLAKMTLLGRPTQPRQYRYQHQQPGPQVTQPDAHRAFVGTKDAP